MRAGWIRGGRVIFVSFFSLLEVGLYCFELFRRDAVVFRRWCMFARRV